MMVEQPSRVDPALLKRNVDQAATKLSEISGKGKVSQQEIRDLKDALKAVNTTLADTSADKSFWGDKKTSPKDMNASIEKALNAVNLFQRAAGQKNVEQAIASLFSSLASDLQAFDKNLRNLKEYKIGQRVEKTGESKKT